MNEQTQTQTQIASGETSRSSGLLDCRVIIGDSSHWLLRVAAGYDAQNDCDAIQHESEARRISRPMKGEPRKK